MAVIYLLLDDVAAGGYYSAQDWKPDMSVERRTIREVREVKKFPDDVWALVLQGGLPVDDDDSHDSTWAGWWPRAKKVWRRD